MASFVPTTHETLEDQRRYTEAHLTEVPCLDCLARVGVRKNSEQHTSIQWSSEARQGCPEFARMDRAPGGRAVRMGCPRLTASIDAAVRDGRIPIGDQDGY